MKNLKVLVIGSDGQIGNYLFQRAKKLGITVFGSWFTTDLSQANRVFLDITKHEECLESISQIKPNIILFPAFNPNVDYCETNPNETKLTNLDPVPPILELCKKNNIKFIYYSSDYIFDGLAGPYEENINPNPISNYGLQKLQVETWIKEALDNYIIERVTWVYGWEILGKNFVVRMLNNLKDGKEVKAPIDQYANPTYAGNIANLTYELIKNNFSGIVNVSDGEWLNRYEFACAVAKFHNLNYKLIVPVKTSEFNQAAKRPLKGGFILNKIETLLNKKMSSLENSMALMQAEKGII